MDEKNSQSDAEPQDEQLSDDDLDGVAGGTSIYNRYPTISKTDTSSTDQREAEDSSFSSLLKEGISDGTTL